jgi:hypothetical protein
MSSGSEPGPGHGPSAEQRAEEIVERIATNASRWLGHALGRAREEFEDLLAEARSLNDSREMVDVDTGPASAAPPPAPPSRTRS